MIIGLGHKKQVGKDTIARIIKWTEYYYAKDLATKEDIQYYPNGPFPDIKEYLLRKIRTTPSKARLANSPNWEIKSFAGKLKEAASIITGIPLEMWEETEFKNSYNEVYKMTNREILQKIGEGLRHNVGESIWVNALFNDYEDFCFSTYTPYIKETNGIIHAKEVDPQLENIQCNYSNWIITDVRMPNEVQAIKDRGGILIKVDKETEYEDNHISETALDDYDGWDYVIDNNGTLEELIDKVEELYDRTEGFRVSK